MSQPDRPTFSALVVHRDPTYRYSLLLPDGWHRYELDDEQGEGAFYAPDPADLRTGLGAQARRIPAPAKPSDLRLLRDAFLEGLARVPGAELLSSEADVAGTLLTMEARQTFVEDGDTRQRWVRLAYQGRVQVRLVAQGSSPERFAYWEPAFYQGMRTFHFGDWWSAAIGVDWEQRAFQDV